MRKISNIIHCKYIFNAFRHCIDGSLFKWFSEGDNGLVCGQPLMLISPGSICSALRDLVAFVQFEKREKHPWRSVNFSKVAG